MPDLLIELFSEEIPARMQLKAAEDLRRLVTGGLVDRGLTYAHAASFATPRRLVLALEELSPGTPTVREERRGPRVDAPEKAVDGFLRSTGVSREDLKVQEDKKGAVFVAVLERPGRSAAEVVAEVLVEVVRSFPWPKSMRWGGGSLRWVRPLHSILCVITTDNRTEVVPLQIDGLQAGNTTKGHRFMAPSEFPVFGFEDYSVKLRAAHVVLDPTERMYKIWHDAEQLAFAQGLEVVRDDGLLAEIAGLVEWPVVLLGRIEERFLDLPPEVLQVVMKAHQKFLSVRALASGRIEGYVVVANRETADGGATVLAGNARVLAARLSDAEYFWRNDLATGLEPMRAKLSAVTFHGRLGTQGERIGRIAALAREIALSVGADSELAERAARLAKADLASEMVYEFPELQGMMGRYYALAAGEDPTVAAACLEHYAPLGPSDAVPEAPVSVAVALADKIDMLTGFWAIGEKPTGSKDPFALRRAALGVIRVLLEAERRLSLVPIFDSHLERIDESQRVAAHVEGRMQGGDYMVAIGHSTVDWRGAKVRQTSINLLSFFVERVKVYLRDQGVRHDVIDAAFGLGGQDDLVLLVARVRALQAFLRTEDGANLLTGYKRAVSILEQEERRDGVEYSLDPHPRLAETEAEKALFVALDQGEAALGPALKLENFERAMAVLAGLRAPIDAFFDTTIVNAENAMVRRNRLCLLHRVRQVMNRVAVFSSIEGG